MTTIKPMAMILSPYDEEGWGGGSGNPGATMLDRAENPRDDVTHISDSDVESDFVEDQGVSDETDTTDLQQGQQVQPQPVTYTEQQVQQMMEMQRGYMQQPQMPQQLQPTRQQMMAALKRPEVSDELATQILGEGFDPRAKAALQALVDSAAAHAIQVNALASRFQAEDLRNEVSPAIQAALHQERQEFMGGITQTFPAFKGKENILNQALTMCQGMQPRNQMEAVQMVVQTASNLIQSVDPTFNPLVQPQRQQAGHGMNSIPTGGSGQSSGQTAGNKRQPKSGWRSVFGR